MESVSQWVSKMGRLFFTDEFVRHTVGTYTSKQLPQQEIVFRAVRAALNDLELRVIEFLPEWMVALLMPAKYVLGTRSPHLAFMLVKECWFRELYLGFKVAASFNRNESHERTIDGQIRCITAPMYHSLRRENIKVARSQNAMGVKIVRPTWFEDETVARAAAEGTPNTLDPMYGLRLTIKEDAIPLREQPRFSVLEEVAARGLLAAETWQCNRSHHQFQGHY